MLLEVADDLGVTPTAGVRIKLATEGSGRWAQSGGEKSKFGLNAAELMQADRSTAAIETSSTSSSSFTSTSAARSPTSASSRPRCRKSRASTSSCARWASTSRTWTSAAGSAWTTTARSSTCHASVNYSLQEYANDVVYTIAEACREHELPMPHIISESGRALTAHHALLLLKVIDVESQAEQPVPELDDDDHRCCTRWSRTTRRSRKKRLRKRQGASRSSTTRRSTRSARSSSSTAACSTLRERAMAEPIYFATVNASRRCVDESPNDYDDIITRPRRDARRSLLLQLLALPVAARQLGDRSALPDHADPPARRGADASRHAAGRHLRLRRQDRSVRRRQDRPARVFELHEFRDEEQYMLGVFLTGAYQEILGDLHNLFGDTNAVHIRLVGRGLRDHRSRARRHGDRSAELRAVPRVATCWRRSGARWAARRA